MPAFPFTTEDLFDFISREAPTMIEFIKDSLWPLVILVIFFSLRKQIIALFPRIKKASLSGVELNDDAEKQASVKESILNPKRDLSQLPGLNKASVVSNLEKLIKSEIEKIAKEQGFSDEEAFDYTINRLAVSRLLGYFSQTYNDIFGSQLSLTYKMKGRSIKRAEVLAIYEFARDNNKEFYQDYSFEQWTGFLVRSELAVWDSDEFRITPLGCDFLQYILDNALPIEKRG